MMLKYFGLVLWFLIPLSMAKAGNSASPQKKVEYVNPDYGILSETDKTRMTFKPLAWRCFSIKEIEVKYRTWPNVDPTNQQRVVEIMCDFEIWVSSKPFQNVYHGRRGKPESYCKDFKDAWSKLTRGQDHICIEGETLSNGEAEKVEGAKLARSSWTWNKIKTLKGCYGFWDGYQCVYL